jgi:MFS transporter, DHA1 family, tetracycline resistance protein
MTRRVGPTEQGRLQGANASLQGVAGLIGPALFTLSFAYAIDAAHGLHLPGVPFLIAALLLLAGGMIGWQASRGETAPAGRAKPAH